ncbi:E3 ubiquitin-protein ligase DZIP3, partial [Stylophora pistillata]
MDLLNICLTSTYFQYNGKHYKQLHGTAMGSPVSVVIAEIVMQNIEERALSTCRQTIPLWLRYVDDTFTAVRHDEIDAFHNHLNEQNTDIQFTREVEENGKLPFLDCLKTFFKASGAALTVHSTKETTNYARLCRLLVDVSSHILRETFDKKRPPGNLDTVLLSPPVHNALQLFRNKKVLNPSQWGKLYPAIKSSVSSQHFDITLLMVLLRNTCNLVTPSTGWDTLPPAADTTLEADIIRIKCYRNTVYGHATEASIDEATFDQYWMDIQDALVRLGGVGYQSVINDLKKEGMD